MLEVVDHPHAAHVPEKNAVMIDDPRREEVDVVEPLEAGQVDDPPEELA